MRILFFVLGSPYKRMVGNRQSSFYELLKEDIVFFGPSEDENFIHNGKVYTIIQLVEETSILKIFEKLPKGWYPEIVAVETPVLNYVYDFYRCPVKTICFSRDAWGEMIYNRKMAELFDFVYYQTIDKQCYQNIRTHLLRTIGSPISIPVKLIKEKPFKKRRIDILAIANYNEGFYHERYKIFFNIAQKLGKKYNVKFITGVKYSDIHEHYRDSKIVFDYSYVMPNRGHEAIMNDCLFFSCEKNILIKDVWIPWEEYIPYTNENLIELLEYYLMNGNKADEVIKTAAMKCKTLPMSPGAASIERISTALQINVDITERIKHVETFSESVLFHCLATPLYFNYNYQGHNHPHNWKDIYFERIDKAVNIFSEEQEKILILIEAARMAFLLKKYDLSLSYLNDLENVLPKYAWIYYLRGKIFYIQKQESKAIEMLKESIECANKAPELLQKFVLPFIEKNNTCDARRVVNFMWQSEFKHNNELQVNSLFYLVNKELGNIYLKIGKINDAIDSYLCAIKYMKIPEVYYQLNELLLKQKSYKLLLAENELGIEENPYDSILLLYSFIANLKLNKNQKGRILLKNHLMALTSFNTKRAKLTILFLCILIILSFSNKILAILTSKKLINKLIIKSSSK